MSCVKYSTGIFHAPAHGLTLAQVKVHVAERTGDDPRPRRSLRPFKDAAGKAGGDVAAGNAHGCAAAFRLQGKGTTSAPRAVMMLSMAIGFSASSNRMMSAGGSSDSRSNRRP